MESVLRPDQDGMHQYCVPDHRRGMEKKSAKPADPDYDGSICSLNENEVSGFPPLSK